MVLFFFVFFFVVNKYVNLWQLNFFIANLTKPNLLILHKVMGMRLMPTYYLATFQTVALSLVFFTYFLSCIINTTDAFHVNTKRGSFSLAFLESSFQRYYVSLLKSVKRESEQGSGTLFKLREDGNTHPTSIVNAFANKQPWGRHLVQTVLSRQINACS